MAPITLATVIAITTEGVFSGTSAFTSASARNISSLTGNTAYYFRAYTTNSAGTGYGSIETFTTGSIAPTVTTGASLRRHH